MFPAPQKKILAAKEHPDNSGEAKHGNATTRSMRPIFESN